MRSVRIDVENEAPRNGKDLFRSVWVCTLYPKLSGCLGNYDKGVHQSGKGLSSQNAIHPARRWLPLCLLGVAEISACKSKIVHVSPCDDELGKVDVNTYQVYTTTSPPSHYHTHYTTQMILTPPAS